MNAFFSLLFCLIITQRLGELLLARKNSRWMKERGGIEVGQNHYKFIVMIHMGFLLSLLMEVALGPAAVPAWWQYPFTLFVLAQVIRYWCIHTLGPFWNTRIYVLPNSTLTKNGPYRWLKHPNYLVVMVEFIVFPLIFGAYWTAAVWSFVNFLFLRLVRIPVEESAWQIQPVDPGD